MPLSPEEKTLIRSYMFKVAIPSGIGLAIISAIGGFLINRVAYVEAHGEAYASAFGHATETITKTVSEAATARKDAEINAAAAAKASKDTADKAAEAQSSASQAAEAVAKVRIATQMSEDMANAAQASSSRSAENAIQAERASRELTELVRTNKDLATGGLNLGTEQLNKIVTDLAKNPTFLELIIKTSEFQRVMKQNVRIRSTRIPVAGYFSGDSLQPLGRHDFCSISAMNWGSPSIAQEPLCRLAEDSGVWTFQNGNRMTCAVTCFDAALQSTSQ